MRKGNTADARASLLRELGEGRGGQHPLARGRGVAGEKILINVASKITNCGSTNLKKIMLKV